MKTLMNNYKILKEKADTCIYNEKIYHFSVYVRKWFFFWEYVHSFWTLEQAKKFTKEVNDYKVVRAKLYNKEFGKFNGFVVYERKWFLFWRPVFGSLMLKYVIEFIKSKKKRNILFLQKSTHGYID